MTEKQISQINIQMAKKLGWRKFKLENTPDPLNTRRMIGVSPGNVRHQFVPNFYGNLSYALQSVRWANEHKYEFQLSRGPSDGKYTASFYNGTDYCHDYGLIASNAIVKAFLKIK